MKPCPFCGLKNLGRSGGRVFCNACQATGPAGYQAIWEDACRRWDSRVEQQGEVPGLDLSQKLDDLKHELLEAVADAKATVDLREFEIRLQPMLLVSATKRVGEAQP